MSMPLHLSPTACAALIDAIDTDVAGFRTADLEEQTDCPEGCTVEPDAYCAHGYLSAAETLLRTVA